MYFCYGIKNSSLEPSSQTTERKDFSDPQPIQLNIPQQRLNMSFKRKDDMINPNKPPLTNGSPFNQEMRWETFE